MLDLDWCAIGVNALVQLFIGLAGYTLYRVVRWLWRRASGSRFGTGTGTTTTPSAITGGGSFQSPFGTSAGATVDTGSLKGELKGIESKLSACNLLLLYQYILTGRLKEIERFMKKSEPVSRRHRTRSQGRRTRAYSRRSDDSGASDGGRRSRDRYRYMSVKMNYLCVCNGCFIPDDIFIVVCGKW